MIFKNSMKGKNGGPEGLIRWWNSLDSVVMQLKSKRAIKLWKHLGIPHRVLGTQHPNTRGLDRYAWTTFKKSNKREFTYNDFKVNPYLFMEQFALWDKQDRIEDIFLSCLYIANNERLEKLRKEGWNGEKFNY